jgi:hypothetical protein
VEKVGKYRCRGRIYTQSTLFMMHLTPWTSPASRMYTSETAQEIFCRACADATMTDIAKRRNGDTEELFMTHSQFMFRHKSA